MADRREAWAGAADDYSRRFVRTCACGGAGFVRSNAPVGHPLFGKAIPCVCLRDRDAAERGERLRRRSGMSGVELSQWTFERFNANQCQPAASRPAMARLRTICQEYAQRPDGWLVLIGATGCGKSHLAYAIAGRALADGRQVYAHTVPAMLSMLRATFGEGNFDSVFHDLCEVGLLVMDDLGAERETEWAKEQLYALVDHRYRRRLPMVVTTNVALTDIDGRIASRLGEGRETRGQGFARILTVPCGDFRPWRRGSAEG